MSAQIDLIYDRLIAEQKLKAGTKYERLAAIAFGVLTGRATVHDLRLRGASGVRHQIDAVVGDEHKRILVETKDYDKVIRLPIIRNFWGAVEDIGPDEAFVVTTVGFTKPAIQYAEAKGIRLALLRPPEEEDWAGVYRKVVLDITMTGQAGLAESHLATPPRRPRQDQRPEHGARSHRDRTAQARRRRRQGTRLPPDLRGAARRRLRRGAARRRGHDRPSQRFDEPTWLIAPGVPPLRVEAWKWELKVASDTIQVVVGDGIGGLVAELALRTIDGSIRRMFTNRQLEAWIFDGHDVIPRAG